MSGLFDDLRSACPCVGDVCGQSAASCSGAGRVAARGGRAQGADRRGPCGAADLGLYGAAGFYRFRGESSRARGIARHAADQSAAAVGSMALRDQQRGRQRAGNGAALRLCPSLSLVLRRVSVNHHALSDWRSTSAVRAANSSTPSCALSTLDRLFLRGRAKVET